MGISFGSINTGLPKDIVQQLVAAERAPITKMEDRKSRIGEKQKLVSELIKIVEDLRTDLMKNNTAKSLRDLKAIYDESIIGVTIDENLAEPGEYRFEVDQMAQRASFITTGFEDPNESYVGVGYVQYTLPNGETRDIYVNSKNASLRGVAHLINADPHCQMKALVVNDGSGDSNPWRLLVSLTKSGNDYDPEIPFFYFIDGDDDFIVDEDQEAHNAIIKLDGFELELPNNNSNSDLIPGLTLDLKRAKPGEEFLIQIVEDRQAIIGKVSAFIEKINKVLQFINLQNQLDAKSDTSKTLGGDVTLQAIESRLRSIMFEPLAAINRTDEELDDEGELTHYRAGDLGINFQRNGLLAFDEKRFGALMAQNFRLATQMLIGVNWEGTVHQGLINKLIDFSNFAIRKPNGMLALRKDGLQSNIDQLNNQIENRERLIGRKEEMLKDKFAKLEETVSKLKAQGAGLASSMPPASNFVTNLG
ncbi:MAG: flagellar filament capping protein FliD [Oligoflexia bacterium]|nr:flagellar filament capping protein FliD [Oligoflexia bacterium]